MHWHAPRYIPETAGPCFLKVVIEPVISAA
jgi:hypothetical protein